MDHVGVDYLIGPRSTKQNRTEINTNIIDNLFLGIIVKIFYRNLCMSKFKKYLVYEIDITEINQEDIACFHQDVKNTKQRYKSKI